jgi:CBS domain-containing protein
MGWLSLVTSRSWEERNIAMKTVRDVLKVKGTEMWSVAPDVSVYHALQQMAEKGIGALMVLDSGKLMGIISERDYARLVELQGRTAKETPVKDIMTTRVVYAGPEMTMDECMAVMTHKRIRHLPVLEHDELVGIISIGDVVKTIISEQQFMLEQLENYITGG